MSSPPRIPAQLKDLLLANKDADVNISADVIIAEQNKIGKEASSRRSYKQALVGDKHDSPPATPAALKGKTPQGYLDAMMSNHGYCIELRNVRISAPTPFQVASHTSYVVTAAKGDPEMLRSLLRAGISPNPCNEHGDSLLNMVCRRGLAKSLQMLIQCGTRFDVSGDGLTPLHEVCWHSPPQFDLVDLVLQNVSHDAFHARDKKGFLPLQYTSASDAEVWIKFLKSRTSVYWPAGDKHESTDSSSTERSVPPSLPLHLVVQLARGQINPKDVWMFFDNDEDVSEDNSTIDSNLSDSSTGFDSCDEFSSDDSVSGSETF